MLKDYPPFQANDFEYLRGRILILLPENDIFKKEDQKRFADLFRKLDAEIRTVPGGHVGFIVQAERYLDLMKHFCREMEFDSSRLRISKKKRIFRKREWLCINHFLIFP